MPQKLGLALARVVHQWLVSDFNFLYLVVAIADVRELFGILKKGTSLYRRAMSDTISLFLGADVSDN